MFIGMGGEPRISTNKKSMDIEQIKDDFKMFEESIEKENAQLCQKYENKVALK